MNARQIPIIATLLVVGAAGTLAAVATQDVAVRTGAVSAPIMGWLLPVIIEGGAVTAGLLAWRRTSNGERAWPERLALMVLMVLAVAVNAAHADGSALLGVVLAACPPVVLVVSIELLLRNRTSVSGERLSGEREGRPVSASVRRERPSPPASTAGPVSGPSAPLAERPAPSVSAATAERPTLTSIERSKPSTAKVSAARRWEDMNKAERSQRVDSVLAADPLISGAALGERLGASSATGRRILAKRRGQGLAPTG